MSQPRPYSSFLVTLATGIGIALWIILACHCSPPSTCPPVLIDGVPECEAR